MNKIKSKRAKKHAESLSGQFFSEFGKVITTLHLDDALQAIVLAEQDAEERAVKALKYALKFMVKITDMQKDGIMMHFEDGLNNGGQSDE